MYFEWFSRRVGLLVSNIPLHRLWVCMEALRGSSHMSAQLHVQYLQGLETYYLQGGCLAFTLHHSFYRQSICKEDLVGCHDIPTVRTPISNFQFGKSKYSYVASNGSQIPALNIFSVFLHLHQVHGRSCAAHVVGFGSAKRLCMKLQKHSSGPISINIAQIGKLRSVWMDLQMNQRCFRFLSRNTKAKFLIVADVRAVISARQQKREK